MIDNRLTIDDIEPWQQHEGFIEDNWSGCLTQAVVARLQAAPCFKGIPFVRVLRPSSGKFYHWAISIEHRVVRVDFINFDRQSGLVMLMFNQENLIASGTSYALPTWQIPVESIDLLAYATGIWLSYREQALRGLDWHLLPIVEAFEDLQYNLDIFSHGYPGQDFEGWMRSFFYNVMKFAPEFIHPPYRLTTYGGCAI